MARRFHRVRHYAGKTAAGWKGSAMGVAAGAATSFGVSMATSRIDFLKASQNWWATPIGLAVIGHFVKRKSPPLGYALLGIAGAVGVENFTHTPTNAQGFDAGIGDAGAIHQGYADAGTLFNENQSTDASPLTNSGMNALPAGAGALMGGSYGAGELDNADVMGLVD